MIKAVLFDFDGVLTTDKTGSQTTIRYLSSATGIELPRLQSAFRKFNQALTLGKITHQDIWEDLCSDLGRRLDIALLEAAFASTPMSQGMLSLAWEIRSRCAVGIVTDNKKDRIDFLKSLYGLPSLFDPIVVSAEIGTDKESPGIFEEALRRLRIEAGECVFIDNSQANLVAPRLLGMKTVYFDDEAQDFKSLRATLEDLGVFVGHAGPGGQ